LILEEQNSFNIIGTKVEQFSGMGNFAMTIWNGTCNPCFSTFDQIFVVFHGLKTGSKINGLVMKNIFREIVTSFSKGYYTRVFANNPHKI
jgi:hypothetical protein